ncbi:MAG TPA: YwiC-like family protein [Pyrinomonadaceae bacterium]|nr:YwiC-like family protein [Pyrinomonadaceae bacterium]
MNRTVPFNAQSRGDNPAKNSSAPARVRLRTVALPNEHGGWSLTLEPVVLGLAVAPSPAGLFLAVATLGAFLARHPFKIAAADWRRGRRFARTAAAERFLLLYGGVALASALAAAATAGSYAFLLPLLAALPFASAQLAFDAGGRGRTLLPELAGSFGLAAVAASIAMAGGWPLAASLGLWAVLAGRVVPSILYVRARLRRLYGETPSSLPTVAAHVAALVLVALLAWAGVAPPLALAAFVILLLRAVAGLSAGGGGGSAKQVGISEIFYGVVTVAAVAAGHLV